MKKRNRELLPCRWFYIWLKIMLIYINFSYDFLGLDNVYFKNGSFFKPFKTVCALSDMKHSSCALVFYIW